MKVVQEEDRLLSSRIALLRKKIHNEAYLGEAIQRIALVLSNELLEARRGEKYYEQRKGGK
ncbi:MAG: hypothetical protein LBG76_02045 [Treponema sp.]|jgi:hypothetical protein|nr:hypothetical protein [Treponema sp.]